MQHRGEGISPKISQTCKRAHSAHLQNDTVKCTKSYTEGKKSRSFQTPLTAKDIVIIKLTLHPHIGKIHQGMHHVFMDK